MNPQVSDHMLSTFCVTIRKKPVQHAAAVESARLLDLEFVPYGDTLECIEVFKYPG